MAELVRDHASEQQHDEDHAIERRRLPAEPPMRAGDPDEKQQKGDVNAHHRAGDHGDGDRPEHERLREAGQARAVFPNVETALGSFLPHSRRRTDAHFAEKCLRPAVNVRQEAGVAAHLRDLEPHRL